MEFLKEANMNLTDKVNKVLQKNKSENQNLAKQIAFLEQAQKEGVINKPEYKLASIVNMATSASV